MKKSIAALKYLLSIHILALIILSLLRLTLYFVNSGQVADIDNKSSLLFGALLKGIQFDNMVSCYIIVLPAFILLLLSLLNKTPKLLVTVFNIYFIIVYAIVFAVSIADIPYFSYYFSHLGGAIFNFIGFEGTAGMLFQENSYYIYYALYLITTIAFGIIVFRFGKTLKRSNLKDLNKNEYKYYIPFFILIWGLCFIGMRGRLGRYPLRVSGSYFCSNPFFNQLGVNPAFFLLKSSSDFKKNKNPLEGVMDEKEAITYVQNMLGIQPDNPEYPITRRIQPEREATQANVVIILMESMASEYLNMEYKGKPLTPFIHKFINKSYYFENFYSNGINTNKGIACTLYGFPPRFKRTMMAVQPDLYTGLPITLKEKGYETLFFLTHDPQYDNMYSFLNDNGFDYIYSLYDYPKEKHVNNFGVQDDYLFEYGINRLNETAKSKQPFLATFITVTNHPPYIIPEKFKDAGENDEQRAVAFSDNSLKDFMETASKEEWYKNTIFVILGDHGRVMGKQPYGMSLTYNHVPLIIYSPLFEDAPRLFKEFAGQVDIFPTIMGFLNYPYNNNSLGIDLFQQQRPYTYFVTDDRLGCINDRFLYIFDTVNKEENLFEYRENNSENLKEVYPSLADSMKNYAVSMQVSANYLVTNKLTRPGLKR